MKRALVFSFWFFAQHSGMGQDHTDAQCPSGVISSAHSYYMESRSNIATELRARSNMDLAGPKDLAAIIHLLNAVSNRTLEVSFDARLARAEQEVVAVSSNLASILQDSGNRTIASGLDIREYSRLINRERTYGRMLGTNMARLLSTVVELHRWAELVERIAPANAVSERIRTRLEQLSQEWQDPGCEKAPGNQRDQNRHRAAAGPSPAQPPEQNQIARVPAPTNALTSSIGVFLRSEHNIPIYRTIPTSPALAAVVHLVDHGATEREVTSYIDSAQTAFDLDADKITWLKGKIPGVHFSRMLKHDAELRKHGQRLRSSISPAFSTAGGGRPSGQERN